MREIEKERDRKGKIGREKQRKNNEKREWEGGEIVRKRNREIEKERYGKSNEKANR